MDNVINSNNLDQEVAVFKALAHPTRLRIVQELSESSKCVNELHNSVGNDVSTVSRHISVLKNAGIVSGNKIGLQVFYSLDMACVINFISCIGDKCVQDGEGCCE